MHEGWFAACFFPRKSWSFPEFLAPEMPRKKKVSGRKRPRDPKKDSSIANRPKKYKQWNDVSMLGAMKSVSEGMAITRAAMEFGVPKSTLMDRVTGRVTHGCKSGKAPYLPVDEEQELVEYIITCSKIGYPKKR